MINPRPPVAELDDIDRAVLMAAGMVRDLAASARGKRLTPAQILTVLTVVAVDYAVAHGVARETAVAKLRDIADAMDMG